MDMMPLRINIFFHASNQLVYPIFPVASSQMFNFQEDNDQAFPITR